MQYKIELLYIYGWDDAGWTICEPEDEEGKPWRFETIKEAEEALEEFFTEVKEAVARGDMEDDRDPEEYRIVPVYEDGSSPQPDDGWHVRTWRQGDEYRLLIRLPNL